MLISPLQIRNKNKVFKYYNSCNKVVQMLFKKKLKMLNDQKLLHLSDLLHSVYIGINENTL